MTHAINTQSDLRALAHQIYADFQYLPVTSLDAIFDTVTAEFGDAYDFDEDAVTNPALVAFMILAGLDLCDAAYAHWDQRETISVIFRHGVETLDFAIQFEPDGSFVSAINIGRLEFEDWQKVEGQMVLNEEDFNEFTARATLLEAA